MIEIELFDPMPDIPRIYTALAEWVACMAMISTLKKKRVGIKRCLIYAAMLIIQSVYLCMTEDIELFLWIPVMCGAVVLMTAGIYLQTDCHIRSCAYLGLEAFMISEFMASFEWQIDYFLVHNYSWYGRGVSYIFLFVMYGAIGAFCRYFFSRKGEKNEFYVTRKELVIMAIMSASIFLISNLTFTDFQSPFRVTRYDPVAPALVRTLVDMSGMIMLCFFYEERKELESRKELNAIQNVLQNHYIQYEQAKESIELINIKYHDLKHQIAYLKETDEALAKNEILAQIEGEINLYEAQNKTGNKVVDTILTSKSIICEKKKVTLNCVADGRLLDFMSTADICSILGNALDNAIEAVEKLEDVQKRLVHVAIFSQKNFAILRFENYYEGDIKMAEGLPVTTKHKKEYHGFGVKSIHMIAEKYGGTVNINLHNNWFELQVLLPILSKKTL